MGLYDIGLQIIDAIIIDRYDVNIMIINYIIDMSNDYRGIGSFMCYIHIYIYIYIHNIFMIQGYRMYMYPTYWDYQLMGAMDDLYMIGKLVWNLDLYHD